VATRRGRFITGFRRPAEHDVSVGPHKVGLHSGLEPLLRSLRNALLAVVPRGAKPDAAQVEQARLNARVAELSEQLAAAQRTNAARDAEFQHLRARHRNLSRSLLGRATIKYWNLRRRLRR